MKLLLLLAVSLYGFAEETPKPEAKPVTIESLQKELAEAKATNERLSKLAQGWADDSIGCHAELTTMKILAAPAKNK